jgi:hypothetical protein
MQYGASMNTKSIEPLPGRIASAAIESDELHRPEIDAFIARNREVLNESLLRSYDGDGRNYSVDSVWISEVFYDDGGSCRLCCSQGKSRQGMLTTTARRSSPT